MKSLPNCSRASPFQDKGLTRNASYVLAAMANVEPQLVVPLAHKQFEAALEMVGAAGRAGHAGHALDL